MLQLRKDCQPILDDYGLSELYVTINDPKRLVLMSLNSTDKCLMFPSIDFTDKEPKKADRDYAKVLLNQFLEKHHKLLAEYVEVQKDLIRAKKNMRFTPTDILRAYDDFGIMFTTSISKLVVSAKGIDINTTETPEDIITMLGELPSVMSTIQDYLDKVAIYKGLKRRFNLIDTKLYTIPR